jgi:MFS family permease
MSINEPDTNEPKGIKLIVRAFRHKNYRLFFAGQFVTLVGTWIQQIALSWLVYRLTSSPFLLGLVSFIGQLPSVFLSPLTGVLADRWNRRKILIFTQSCYMLQAIMLSILVLTDAIAIWHIIVFGFLMGIIFSFDGPARQSFVVEMVEEKADLGNAIALNSFMFNGSRLIGPSIGGILIAAVGEGYCFLVNAITYLAVISALLAMKIAPKEPQTIKTNIMQQLKEGFAYTFSIPPIKSILLLLGLISLMAMPYFLLMPVVAKDVLHGGPHTMGLLMTSVGVGALIGAVYLASRSGIKGLEKIIPIATTIFGIGLIGFSFSRITWISMMFLTIVGFGMMVQNVSSNTYVQTIVDDDKRGRVMSFYNMAFFSTMPFGSLMAGGLASRIGAPYTLLISGISCLLGMLVFVSRRSTFKRT